MKKPIKNLKSLYLVVIEEKIIPKPNASKADSISTIAIDMQKENNI